MTLRVRETQALSGVVVIKCNANIGQLVIKSLEVLKTRDIIRQGILADQSAERHGGLQAELHAGEQVQLQHR